MPRLAVPSNVMTSVAPDVPSQGWRIEHAYIVPSNLAEMRHDGILTDLTIRVDGHAFEVHRVVLAASSPYFRALLTNQMSESFTSCVEVHDVASDVFEQILSFMYTGQSCISSFRNAVQLLAAAERFIMSDLAHITFQSLKERAGVGDYPELYAEGRRLCIHDLESFAFAKCCEHFAELETAKAFLLLPEPLLLELLECDFLMVSNEETVITMGLAWIQESTERSGAAWPRVFKSFRFHGMDPGVLPRLWPRLQAHCTDLASCRGLLCGLSGVTADGAEDSRNQRWLLQKTSNQNEQIEMAQRLFHFTTSCPERGHLGAMLLARKSDGAIRREVVNMTQNAFERAVEEGRSRGDQCDRIPNGVVVFSVANFITYLVEAELLADNIIRNAVVPELKGMGSDDARLMLCTLRHGLLQKRERAKDNVHVRLTIDCLVEVLESELSHAKSAWMKLELQKAIRELRG